MDARERWQALQARLTAARAAVDAGDRDTALAEIAAALDLDKDFLAAHSLRDCILTLPADGAPPPLAPAEPAARPMISPDGYAKFEQRAKRRRVDRRIDAARAAIAHQRLRTAAIALDEVIELDPNLPELAELTASFDELRRATATRRRGPWIAAAAVFIGALLGASWLQDSSPILPRQIVSAAPLAAPLTPIVTVTEQVVAVATTGRREAGAGPAVDASPAPDAHTGLAPAAPRLTASPINTPPPALTADVDHAVAAAAIVAPAVTLAPVALSVDAPDDSLLVKEALQRYRTAYEGLDAQSAQAIWPAVNQAALARAFDGLESQTLTFDACDVRLRGDAATAVCQGSARYVPKVGSRDPRTEPRVWNFTLHKTGSDWKIESARAEQ